MALPVLAGELRDRISSEVKGEVKCIGFSPSGSHMAIGFDSGELRVLDWPSLKAKFALWCVNCMGL